MVGQSNAVHHVVRGFTPPKKKGGPPDRPFR
jgi:hypothetical protein